jgi:hypothetical protein
VIEMLPNLQAEIEALHAEVMGGEERAKGTAIASGLTGRTENLSHEAYELVSDITGGRYGAQMLEAWTREDPDATGASEQDWALECEIAWHAIRRGHADEGLARIVEETMRAGPYRTKWDERRGQTTWLAQDVANAIATVKKRRSAQEPPSIAPDDGSDTAAAEPLETPEQIIARLERELAKERAASAVKTTIIRGLQAENARLKAWHEEDRRLRLAERELDKVKGFSATQKAAIKVTAGILSSAVSRDVAPQVITRGMVAEEMGCHEATAGAAAKVFDLPGSPVRRMNVRTNELDEDGMARPKIVTQYSAETASPAEIIEGMIRVAEGLAERHRRYEPKRCPQHPDAETYTQTRCAVCHDLVAGEKSPCERLAPMGASPKSVAVPLPITSDSLLWGAAPNGHANGYANGHTDGHGNGVALLEAPPWRCPPPCGALERHGGRCLGCGEPAP